MKVNVKGKPSRRGFRTVWPIPAVYITLWVIAVAIYLPVRYFEFINYDDPDESRAMFMSAAD